MMPPSDFHLQFGTHQLACDWVGARASNPLVIFHGAGNGTRDRFVPLRQKLVEGGISSLALDFIGHGKTGGKLGSSSLSSRTQQGLFLIEQSEVLPPLRLLGSSMGAYNAIKLVEIQEVSALILFVPGVYSPESYEVPFGPNFSHIIRQERNWESTDAWRILDNFRGDLLIVAAGEDQIIPREIPERLFDAATHARSRELHWIKASPHLLVHYLNENTKEMTEVFEKARLLLQNGV